MVIMGGSIVEATKTSKALQIVGTQVAEEACCIFLVKHDPNMGMLTSRRADIDVDDR